MHRSLIQGVLGLALSLMLVVAGSTAVHADPRDFTLINESRTHTIIEVYASPSNVNDWGEDILRSGVLLPGESIDIVFHRFHPSFCFYDILVVFKDGTENVMAEVDLCSTTWVSFW